MKLTIRMLGAAAVAWLAAASPVPADEDEPPLLRPEDRVALDRQGEELAAAASQVTREVGRSVVWVWKDRIQKALGTVVGDGGQVLTKWSEVAGAPGAIRCVTADGRTLRAKVSGVYQEDDLVVLDLEGGKLPPMRWSAAPAPGPGRFVVAGLPDGRAAALGTVAVGERSLRETDQAFLGIEEQPGYDGPGLRVGRVVEGSGAQQAGVQPGDVILRVGDRRVSGLFELRTALIELGLGPGDTARLWLSRRGDEREVAVVLGNRPRFPQFPVARLRQMERMAGAKGLSRRTDGFPGAIESDIKIWPEHCGGPAVDLDGRVVGVFISRATRTRSFIIPTARVMELLKQQPEEPALARSDPRRGEGGFALPGGDGGEPPAVPEARPRRRGPALDPGALERRRARVEEMRMFLERFMEEMEGLERR